jgi:hypothetical protein
MKPIIQIYSLVLYDMTKFNRRRKRSFIQEIKTIEENIEDNDKKQKKIQSLKDKEVEKILFSKYLTICNNKKNNNQMITSFFK